MIIQRQLSGRLQTHTNPYIAATANASIPTMPKPVNMPSQVLCVPDFWVGDEVAWLMVDDAPVRVDPVAVMLAEVAPVG